MAVIGYAEIRKILTESEADKSLESFADWSERNGLDQVGVRKIAYELAEVAIRDMRDKGEMTLAETLAGMFTSGMVAGYGVVEIATG